MANDFAFEVSLFVRHSSIALVEIEREMSGWRVECRVNAGAMFVEYRGTVRRRETPAPFTFWSTTLTPPERPHSTIQTLDDFLTEVLARLVTSIWVGCLRF